MEYLQSVEYQKLLDEFTFFLETTGFAPMTIASRHRNLKEFLLYMEGEQIMSIKHVRNRHLQNFMAYQQQRKNRVYGTALSASTINQYGTLLNKLVVYLRDYKQQSHLTVSLPYQDPEYRERQTLSAAQMAELFEFTFEDRAYLRYPAFYEQRNRALLCIYYCCGLRKSEGANLEVRDVQSDRLMVHVRKGKGNRGRYVPVTVQTMQMLTEYIHGERERILQLTGNRTERFFISEFGNPCSGEALSVVFRTLVRRCGNAEIYRKRPSLHTMRHSIATHLLQQGMDIVLIQQFLGHKTLDTTQIYTHLVNEL